MAKRKYYGVKQARLFEKYGSTREATWRRYKKTYMKIAETYGENMSPMLPKEEFLKAYQKEINLSDYGAAPSVRTYTYGQVLTTHKEAKAASENFNDHLQEICDKINKKGHFTRLSKYESNLIYHYTDVKIVDGKEEFVPKKITYKDVRANNDKWQDIYDLLKTFNAQDQMLGSP